MWLSALAERPSGVYEHSNHSRSASSFRRVSTASCSSDIFGGSGVSTSGRAVVAGFFCHAEAVSGSPFPVDICVDAAPSATLGSDAAIRCHKVSKLRALSVSEETR